MKKNNNTIILILLLIFAIIFVIFTYKKGLSQDNENYRIQQTINRLEDDNISLKDKLQNLNQEIKENQEKPKEIQNINTETEEEIIIPVNNNNTKKMMFVKVPLIKWNGSTYIINWKEKEVLKKPTVLNSVYNVLFMDSELVSEGLIHPLQNAQLSFNSVSLSHGVARVNVTGSFRPSGAMSGFYIRKGIDAAAFQYDTVDTVEVYLNGLRWNWCDYSEADISESNCDTNPKYWIDSRNFYENL